MKNYSKKSKSRLSKLFLLAGLIFTTSCATEELTEGVTEELAEGLIEGFTEAHTVEPEALQKSTSTEPVIHAQIGVAYFIRNKNSSKYLDHKLWGRDKNIHQWSFTGHENQMWKFEWFDESVRMINVASGQCAQIEDGSMDLAGNLVAGNCGDHDKQKFMTYKHGATRNKSTYHFIGSIKSGKFIDVELESEEDGANVHQWDRTFAENQIWEFYPAD